MKTIQAMIVFFEIYYFPIFLAVLNKVSEQG